MKKNKLKSISELGEFGLISHITKDFKITNKRIIKGVGDDAAVIKAENECTVITTDLLVEGIHFDLIYTPLKHLGYKSVIVNISDLYAMNCTPSCITVSIALSNKFSLEAIEDLYSGIKMACDIYGLNLIGGDTSSSMTGLLISITAIGHAKEDEIVYRNTAKTNDLICVTGDLGAAYLGLQLLEREKKLFLSDNQIQPELDEYEYLLERQLKPEARKDIIKILSENNIKPTSMIDISDGLSSEILHICKESNKGCRIYEEKIPIHNQSCQIAEKFNMSEVTAALNGGEDYELLFTVPLSQNEIIAKIPSISIIGHVCDKSHGANLILRDGSDVPLIAQGWNSVK